MDIRATLDRAVAEATTLIDAVTDDMLDRPTPCAQWAVRELLNHMVGVTTMLAVAGEEGELTAEEAADITGTDWVSHDLPGAWRAASKRETSAYQSPTALEDTVVLPSFGALPGQFVLSIAVFDLTTHCADLAHATGLSMPSDPLLEQALAIGTQLLAQRRDPSNFDPEQPVTDDAPAPARLLAFAGRHV